MTAPDTIVLIHGFWVTPRSWEDWTARYEAAGYKVLAPAYPGFEVEVEALRADPSPIEDVRVPAIIEHLESVIGAVETPPILMGHSAGGAFMQVVMDHGFGAAGVALNSAPTEGVPVVPFSQVKSTFPVLKNPANHHRRSGSTSISGRTRSPTASATSSPRRSTSATTSRRPGGSCGTRRWPTSIPGHQDTWVDYKNDDRAPLLFVSGDRDHLMPPSIQASNAKHYKSDRRSPRSRSSRARISCRPRTAGRRSPTTRSTGPSATPRPRAPGVNGVQLTHIGGPTLLVEVGGWRLLTDPTFDAPGRQLPFGWGTASRKLAGPSIAAADVGAIDAVLLTHDHHDDNLDAAGRALLPAAGMVITTVPGARRLGNARGLAVADDAAGGPRQADDRDHGDAVPPRPSGLAPDRRRRRRLRAELGRPAARRALDLG